MTDAVQRRALDRLRAAPAGERASILQAMALTEQAETPSLTTEAGWTPLWADGQRSAFHLRLAGHAGPVRAVVFSEAGGRPIVVSGGDDQSVRLWDAADGELLRTLTGHTSPIAALATAAVDGHPVLASADDTTVRLWDPATGAALRTITPQSGEISGIAFADGVLLTATSAGNVDRWDPATGAHLGRLHERDDVTAIIAVPVGARTLVADLDDTLCLWDPVTGERLAEWDWDGAWPPRDDYDDAALEGPLVACQREGRSVVGAVAMAECGGADPDNVCGTLVWWDAETYEEVERTRLDWDTALLAATPDGRRATVYFHRNRWSREAKGPDIRVEGSAVLRGHHGAVLAGAFGTIESGTVDGGTADRRTVLATAGEDGTVRVWDADSSHRDDSYRTAGTGIAVAGDVVAVTQGYSRVDLLDARTGAKAGALACEAYGKNPGHRCDGYTRYGMVDHNSLCVTAVTVNGRALFATGGTAEGVPLWDPATGGVRRVLEYKSPASVIVAGEVDGRTVLAIGGRGLVSVWDPATGDKIAGLRDGENTGAWHSTAIAFGTLGSSTVVVTGESMRVDVWDPLTGRHLLSLPGHGHRGVSGLAAGADTVAAAHDGEIRLWDLTTGKRRWTAPADRVTCLASIGDRLVSGAQDGTVRLWDLPSGEPLATLATFARPVQAVTTALVDGAPCVFALATSGRVTACRL